MAQEKPHLAPHLAKRHPADVADLLEQLPLNQRLPILQALDTEHLADVLVELEDGAQEEALRALSNATVAETLAEMDSDDAADILQQLGALENDKSADVDVATIHKLAQKAAKNPKTDINEAEERQKKRLAKYAPDTAGGLMKLEGITATAGQTIGAVRQFLQSNPQTPLGSVHVLDKNRKLLGLVTVDDIVRRGATVRLNRCMLPQALTVYPETPQEDVIDLFEKYDFFDLPVVNKRGQLLGHITQHEAFDAVLQKQEEQTFKAAGLDTTDDLFAPTRRIARHRLPWLIVNLGTAIAASAVIALFQTQIEQLVALAVLMPIVASMGGNAASQTLTVTVRGLAMQQISKANAWRLLGKELAVGLFNGVVLAALVALGAWLFYGNPMLGAVILAATIANHIFAAFAGYLIPLALKKWGQDPAISSGVLVTAVTDVGGFFAFLGLAAWVLL